MLNLSNLNSKALAVFISVATAVSCSKSSSPASIDPQPDKVFAELKKEGAIVSPVRCKWEPAQK